MMLLLAVIVCARDEPLVPVMRSFAALSGPDRNSPLPQGWAGCGPAGRLQCLSGRNVFPTQDLEFVRVRDRHGKMRHTHVKS
jgi:hypothetical protein